MGGPVANESSKQRSGLPAIKEENHGPCKTQSRSADGAR
jgi:hypothetical protein